MAVGPFCMYGGEGERCGREASCGEGVGELALWWAAGVAGGRVDEKE